MSVPHAPEPLESDQPGAFQVYIEATRGCWMLHYNCPCGCPFTGLIALEAPGETRWVGGQAKFWYWDGSLTHPTLSPSIRRYTPCKVHFSLDKGRYIVHGDGAPRAPNLYQAP